MLFLIFVMDRGFFDFERLYRFHQAGCFFLTRGKSNLNVRAATRIESIARPA
jgi:hypothetical protein